MNGFLDPRSKRNTTDSGYSTSESVDQRWSQESQEVCLIIMFLSAVMQPLSTPNIFHHLPCFHHSSTSPLIPHLISYSSGVSLPQYHTSPTTIIVEGFSRRGQEFEQWGKLGREKMKGLRKVRGLERAQKSCSDRKV